MEKEYYESLLKNSISLYTKGTLMQYGLREDQALEIVSNLTGIAPEKLQELKELYLKLSYLQFHL